MNEFSVAIGLTSLESLDEFVAANRDNYHRYKEGLRDIPGIRLAAYDERERNNYQYVVLEVDEEATEISRDDLIRVLWAENVLARRYFYPGCHRMEPYRSQYPRAGESSPITEGLSEKLLLPTGTAVDPDQASDVCKIIRTVVSQGPEIRDRLFKKLWAS